MTAAPCSPTPARRYIALFLWLFLRISILAGSPRPSRSPLQALTARCSSKLSGKISLVIGLDIGFAPEVRCVGLPDGERFAVAPAEPFLYQLAQFGQTELSVAFEEAVKLLNHANCLLIFRERPIRRRH